MKGLEDYISKYGFHFTERLAKDAVPIKWDSDDVLISIRKKVYYNVTGSTVGDMVYLTNKIYFLDEDKPSKNKCIDAMLSIVADYFSREEPFKIWLSRLEDFDFSLYI